MRQRKEKDKANVSEGRKGFATEPRYTHFVFRAGWSPEVDADEEAEADVLASMIDELWYEAAGTRSCKAWRRMDTT